MNFSTLFAAVVALIVVLVQQSNADDSPTLLIQEGYKNATNLVLAAEQRALEGLSDGEELIETDPEEAKQTIQQGLLEAAGTLFKGGVDVFRVNGRVLELLNGKSKDDLQAANVMIQKVGYGAIAAVKGTSSLIDQGIDAGEDKTDQALKSVRVIIKSCIRGILNTLKLSEERAMKAIENSKSSSGINLGLNLNLLSGSGSSPQDSEALPYIERIKESAKEYVDEGGNADIINPLRDAIINGIADILKGIADEKKIIENIRNPTKIESTAAMGLFYKQSEAIKLDINKACANILLALGVARQRSGTASNQQIGEAIDSVDQGKVNFFYELASAEQLAVFGLTYPVNESGLGVDPALEILHYCKLAFLEAIAQGALTAF